jgi:UDP-2,3-diacylglucosamine hydrolase
MTGPAGQGGRTAIVAGSGLLPAALAAAAPDRPLVAALDGFTPEGIAPDLTFRVERLVPFLRHLSDLGVTRVCFAGAVRRPRLDPSLFDPDTAQLVPRLLGAMQAGDDATLRAVVALFEDEGFAVIGAADLAPALLPPPGLLAGALPPGAEADAARAAAIVQALGQADVGQGCIVQQGLCLAVEALPGTDHMLATVAALPAGLRPGPGGLLYKAAKPGQDRRIDLPALGPATVRHAAAAGLQGIAFAAGDVLLLTPDATVQAARAAGLFLWARQP